MEAKMKNKIHPLNVKEALKWWDEGKSVFSIEMGGLGPGYEQCIHICVFELIREFANKKLPKENDKLNDVMNKTLWDNKKIDFSIGAGGVVCNKHYDDTVVFLSADTCNILRQIYNNKDVEMNRASVDEIEKFIPDYLYYHLNNLVLHSLKHLK